MKQLTAAALIVLFASVSIAEQRQVRIACYNIKFLKANISSQRTSRLKAVIENLHADIIGLEEIEDRAALENIFDPQIWQLVIDDESGDAQDVAMAVRRPLKVTGLNSDPNDFDADDDDYLFPGDGPNTFYPNRRDALIVSVAIPNTGAAVSVIVMHLKSRLGGRDATDSRREGAAELMLHRMEQDFDGRNFVILGDMNDNPDDRSMNLLEAGDPNAAAGSEQIDGPFISNLTESLLVDDHVSWGLKAGDIIPGTNTINTVKPGSRQQNNVTRGTAGQEAPILFDQILVPVQLRAEHYVADSVHVFDGGDAVSGSGDNVASDHVPVYADFVFGNDFDDGDGASPAPAPGPAPAGVRIVAVLPNPPGTDEGNERITIKNFGGAAQPLNGWRLRDRAGNELAVESGDLQAGTKREVAIPAGKLPLNNSGDDVVLIDASGAVVHRISYSRQQAQAETSIGIP